MKTARDTEFSGSYQEVRDFYRRLRVELYARIRQRYPEFRAGPISYSDCIEADSWRNMEPDKRNDWYWTQEFPYYQRYFKRFDISFKNGPKLVSLAYGVPTTHKTGLKVNIIESTPIKEDKLGLRGFETISAAAQIYALMLGANEVRIMAPTSSKSRSHYCSFGYDYVSNIDKPSQPDYCVLRLD